MLQLDLKTVLLSIPTKTLQKDQTYPGTLNSTHSKAFDEAYWHAVPTSLFLKNAVLENQLDRKSHAKQLWFEGLDLCPVWPPVPSGDLTQDKDSDRNLWLWHEIFPSPTQWESQWQMTGWFWWLGAWCVLKTMKRMIPLPLTACPEYMETI